MFSLSDEVVPTPLRTTLRGIGQVFFQENALTGGCFLLGIALSSPIMALGAIVGAAIGAVTAKVLKFDEAEVAAGIYGFNATLVGIATLFFFKPGGASLVLLVVGSIAAVPVTRLMRRYVPFPTYTSPFIVLTWAIYFLGLALKVPQVAAGDPLGVVGFVGTVAHGVSQVMFQASLGTGLLFVVGIALSDWRHAAWVLVGSMVGMLVGNYHATAAVRALDPERLVDRSLFENVELGLYGYNATLAAVALYLSKRSLIPPLLGILLSVPITELVPRLGLPALTAPFVLATWLVLAFGWLEGKFLREPASSAT
ncbi:urea transporter [Singulisphaera sp. GP187]|uniref:urea transporter n=1 Tax=Singulisphaera sp. GP187 TaxID=1882752 RepID=UPI000926978C|nr:urea transporter [Singulisphaera sp. GP187]SIO65849.1 urea transporter [Singulisphaera sp. GP187]